MNKRKFLIKTIPVSKIKIGKRLRKDLGNTDSLAQSIDEIGLLQPPVITLDYWLVNGERRLVAIRKLGWKEVLALIMPFKHRK